MGDSLMTELVRMQRGPLDMSIPKPVIPPTGVNTPPPPTGITPPPPTNGGGTPMYGDIFNYLNPNTEAAKQYGWLTQAPNGQSHYETDKDGNSTLVQDMGYQVDQSKIPAQYRGMIQGMQGVQGNGIQTQYDFSKMPKTVFGGDVSKMQTLGTGAQPNFKSDLGAQTQHIVDPSKVKWDPNYGWITPQDNIKTQQKDAGGAFGFMDKYGMGIGLGLMSMGLASPLATALTAGFGGLKNYGDTGNWKQALLGAAPGLIGGGIGMSGLQLPPGVAEALKYAKYGKGAYDAINMMRHS